MLKYCCLFLFIISSTCFSYEPRLKFLMENPQNIEHDRGYFKGEFSILKNQKSLLGSNSGNLEVLNSVEINVLKQSEEYFLSFKGNNNPNALISDNYEGLWIKAIISSFVFNDASKMISLLGLDLTDDFDQEAVSFLEKYIENFEKEKAEVVEDKPVEEVSLKDISKVDDEKIIEEETIETVLEKRFYKKNDILTFSVCDFGPCFKINNESLQMGFEREGFNLRTLEILSPNKGKVIISFDNYQKIGGRYNFPKNISISSENEKYLIKLDSYYLSKRIPRIKKGKETPTFSIDQIFSI